MLTGKGIRHRTLKRRLTMIPLCGLLLLVFTLNYAKANDTLNETDQLAIIKTLIVKLQQSNLTVHDVNRVEAQLSENFEAYDYAGYESPQSYADKLSKDIQALLKTESISIGYGAEKASDVERLGEQALSVQLALGDVAFLDVDFNASRHAIDEAFKQIEKSDALILDLRDDEGGNKDSMEYFAGYLFNESTAISESRPKSVNITYQSVEQVDGNKRAQVPLYLLTNKNTKGLPEIFAVSVQQRKGAYIVGEQTAGQVELTKELPLSNGFYVSMPFAEMIEPKSNMAINGKGVIPQLPVVSILAYKESHPLAKESAIEYRVAQGRGTPQEKYAITRDTIEYGNWLYAKGNCLLSYRVAQPSYNQATSKYQFPYQIKYYGNGKTKVSYEMGNQSGKMRQTVKFRSRDDVKSGISKGFNSHLSLSIERCQRLTMDN